MLMATFARIAWAALACRAPRKMMPPGPMVPAWSGKSGSPSGAAVVVDLGILVLFLSYCARCSASRCPHGFMPTPRSWHSEFSHHFSCSAGSIVQRGFGAAPKMAQWLRLFMAWICVPLALAYLAIFELYIARIAISWDLPDGRLAWLTIGVAGLGVLAHMLAYPDRARGPNWSPPPYYPDLLPGADSGAGRVRALGVGASRCLRPHRGSLPPLPPAALARPIAAVSLLRVASAGARPRSSRSPLDPGQRRPLERDVAGRAEPGCAPGGAAGRGRGSGARQAHRDGCIRPHPSSRNGRWCHFDRPLPDRSWGARAPCSPIRHASGLGRRATCHVGVAQGARGANSCGSRRRRWRARGPRSIRHCRLRERHAVGHRAFRQPRLAARGRRGRRPSNDRDRGSVASDSIWMAKSRRSR